MENLKITSIDEVDDISSIDAYQVALDAGCSPKDALHLIEKYGRDNARTPFQWNDKENAGFTDGTPWLRINPNYKEINLAAEENDPDSVFAHYKKLSALRKSDEYKDALVYGDLIPYLPEKENLIAYYRKGEDHTMLILSNFQNAQCLVPLPKPVKAVVLNNLSDAVIQDNEILLGGYQSVVLELSE